MAKRAVRLGSQPPATSPHKKKPGPPPKVTPEQAIAALNAAHGIQAVAARSLGVDRSTIASYIEKNATVRAAYEQVNEATIDYVEGELLKQIQQGNITGIIFFLKTKAKHRGYVERTESNVDLTSKGEKLLTFDYGRFIHSAERPVPDRDASGENQSDLHGQTVGQDADVRRTGAGNE